jgi:hypothetical protein
MYAMLLEPSVCVCVYMCVCMCCYNWAAGKGALAHLILRKFCRAAVGEGPLISTGVVPALIPRARQTVTAVTVMFIFAAAATREAGL